jgi:hypothetical protein
MPEYCTCGTLLVENARFCHRCGRPTAEFVDEATSEQAVPPPLPPQLLAAQEKISIQAKLAQLPVSFSNPIALRVAFLMSLAIIPVEMAPVLNWLFLVWWLGAGWCAVLLYRRLTGLVLSVRAGARLGSITGVLTFVSLAVGFSVSLAVAGKEFFAQMDQTAKEMAKQNPEAAQLIHEPMAIFFSILVFLALLGVVVIGICAAGGALGARFAARKANG